MIREAVALYCGGRSAQWCGLKTKKKVRRVGDNS
jgi:hypothetical protein